MGAKSAVSSIPMLLNQWDYDMNPDDPATVNASERSPARHWKCSKCGYRWESSVESRKQSKGSCPCCSGRAILSGYNDVLTLVPDILNLFSPDDNPGIDLSTLGIGSKARIVWKCPDCGRQWKTELHARIQSKNGCYEVIPCPHRNTLKRKPEDVPFISEEPSMLRFWDYSNNPDPSTIKSNSTTPVSLCCPDCGHRWFPSPVNFFRGTRKCPACELRHAVKPGVTDVFTLVPQLMDYYDPALNPGVDMSKLGISSKKEIHWRCPICKREWFDPVCFRILSENGEYRVKHCRECYLKDPERYVPVAAVPELTKFWDYSRNTRDINLTASNSTDSVYWRCKICGHEWQASPHSRLRTSGECPCCGSGKAIVSGYNDALTIHPELAKIYDPDLNPNISLSTVASTSNTEFLWKCSICGCVWTATVRNTLLSFCHCPSCNNSKVIPGFNSFRAMHPDLMLEWNFINNYAICDPDTISDSYEKNVWWICPNNSSHIYPMPPCERTMYQKRGKESCPFCKGLRRKKRHFI